MTGRKRVLSGMQPSGLLHLGNYLGALENWKALQDQHECYFFVADWHALSSNYADTSRIREFVRELLIDWLAAGIDPVRSTVFIQSRIPEHAVLHLLFSMIIPVSWLERNPTYKEKQEEIKEKDLSTYGFLGYPVLQAADILLYKPDFVPVGKDQLPHLELTRELARRFNSLYGSVFPEPMEHLTKFPKVLGTDGRKMSKSYGNTIDLADDAESVRKKIRSMYTDPKRVRADIPGTVEGNPVFIYHDAFNPNRDEVDDLKSRYREGTVGDVEVKTRLAAAVETLVEPIRERRQAALARRGYIREVLMEGSRKARTVAQETMERVRAAVRLKY